MHCVIQAFLIYGKEEGIFLISLERLKNIMLIRYLCVSGGSYLNFFVRKQLPPFLFLRLIVCVNEVASVVSYSL